MEKHWQKINSKITENELKKTKAKQHTHTNTLMLQGIHKKKCVEQLMKKKMK